MSNQGKFTDNTPFIRNAGMTTMSGNISADHSVRQDVHFNPRTTTPEHIRKYRKSTREAPGVKQVHYGVFNDPKEYENYLHGMKTKASEHVPDCIKGDNLSGVNYFVNKIKEDKYAKNQREPLGESIMRNYIFPEKVKDDLFKFGIPTLANNNAKEIIYSVQNLQEAEEVKKLYNRTHGLTDPGEQKNRNYNWYVDKSNHIFGKTQPKEFDGTKKSLTFDFLEANFPKTKIVNKRLEDYRQATNEMVGKQGFKGTLHPKIDESHIFGVKSVLGANWNVAKCIYGDADEKLNEPDVDLGKTVTYRSKLQTIQPKDVDPEKIFGIPSIRHDLKRTIQSVSDLTNYGTEKDVFELLYPNPHVVRGVDDPDFNEFIDRDNVKLLLKFLIKLREILSKKNYTFKDEEYNLIFAIALKNYPNENDKVSYKAFIDVMRNLKKEFMKYRTLINQ